MSGTTARLWPRAAGHWHYCTVLYVHFLQVKFTQTPSKNSLFFPTPFHSKSNHEPPNYFSFFVKLSLHCLYRPTNCKLVWSWRRGFGVGQVNLKEFRKKFFLIRKSQIIIIIIHHQLEIFPGAGPFFLSKLVATPLVVLVRREGPSPVFLNVTPVTTAIPRLPTVPPPWHHQDDDGCNPKGTASFTIPFWGRVFIFYQCFPRVVSRYDRRFGSEIQSRPRVEWLSM